ncbi:MAG: SAM-dependent methyltransferase [Candidatus Daviesbacteria bacterium]|nr:SAM-dependent methyltransferase [Candidatus Daviesbacteria bacterium]
MSSNFSNGSFRDPSGRVFLENGKIYRTIDYSYKDNYDQLIKSGLYAKLTSLGLLIPHREVKTPNNTVYRTIRPEHIPFVSYPYEWCFSQFKDAALTTLRIQKIALENNMSLKDASSFNIQFFRGKPILIDTLSFEKYQIGLPWIAYRQFCMHFLAPLLLMSQKNLEFNKILSIYIDGVPLNLTSTLLPKKTYLNFSALTHIHLHSRMEKHFGGRKVASGGKSLSKKTLIALVENLEKTIQNIKLKNEISHWSKYYQDNSYSSKAFSHKKKIVDDLLKSLNIKTALDIGSNTGFFSRLYAKRGINTISIDNDHLSVEKNYLTCKKENIDKCLPLCVDITNPSPSIGWNNEERLSFIDRGPFDLILALALIHHLAIGYNIPLENIAKMFSKLGRNIIVEFVAKADLMVQRLLANRKDIFPNYTRENFEIEFSKFFQIKKVINISGSIRSMYLFKNRIDI